MKHVLFVCTHNAGRSQMAAAFFNRHAPADLLAESAGQRPARAVWPQVIAAMREVGIDLSAERPKKVTTEMQLHADRAVTLACGGRCPFVPTTVEEWDVEDPSRAPLERVRAIRDELQRRVFDLLEHRADAIRADRTAHELRLERLLPDLAAEFGAAYSDEELRAIADDALAPFADAPVRSFAMTLAYKHARERLRGLAVPS